MEQRLPQNTVIGIDGISTINALNNPYINIDLPSNFSKIQSAAHSVVRHTTDYIDSILSPLNITPKRSSSTNPKKSLSQQHNDVDKTGDTIMTVIDKQPKLS